MSPWFHPAVLEDFYHWGTPLGTGAFHRWNATRTRGVLSLSTAPGGLPEIVSPADPFTIQARVATRVAEALDVAMAARERTTMAMRATEDTGAFAGIVRGKRIYEENTTSSYSEYEKALREFERAYRRDPGYADALGLAAQT